MDSRLALALGAGRVLRWLSRHLGAGGGTVLPGRVMLSLCPDALVRLARLAREGIILITGTNGKTTTSRMVAAVLRRAGLQVVSNSAGANLEAGVATALLDLPRKAHRGPTVAVLEVDEFSTPRVAAQVRPRRIVVHNFFRDQLDRYGELDTVAAVVGKALQALPLESIALLNADDPLVAHLAACCPSPPWFYGLHDLRLAEGVGQHASDARYCLACGAKLEYSACYFSHIGLYSCLRCGARRPRPQVEAERVVAYRWEGSEVSLRTPRGCFSLKVPLAGLYNVYNALAAAAVALSLGIAPQVVQEALAHFRPAFGRGERIRVGDKWLHLLLVKNPTGFNQVLHLLCREAPPSGLHLLILINDRIADGRDISWLWDVDFEGLEGKVARATVSGTRAWDMALRLKYAQIGMEGLQVEEDPAVALRAALEKVPSGGTLWVLPTYTALLDLRKHLAWQGYTLEFWREEG